MKAGRFPVFVAVTCAALLLGGTGTKATASGNQSNIFFHRFDPSYSSAIMVMDTDGENVRTITDDGGEPVVSPNGQTILFGRDGELFVMTTNGHGVRQLTDNDVADADAGWSPDGTKIVFVRQGPNEDSEIYTMNANGTGVQRLTNNDVTDRMPNWSPNGDKIVFMSRPFVGKDAPIDLYSMNADGTERQALVSTPTRDEGYPVWSPDGTKVAFVGVERETQQGGIFTVAADGTGEAFVTPHGDGPVWSPDGTKIAFATYAGIATVNTDGTNRRQLTEGDDWVSDWTDHPSNRRIR